MTKPNTTPAASASRHTPLTYRIKPFYSIDNKSGHPDGWDVWESNGVSECVCSPCDSADEAKAELTRLIGGVE